MRARCARAIYLFFFPEFYTSYFSSLIAAFFRSPPKSTVTSPKAPIFARAHSPIIHIQFRRQNNPLARSRSPTSVLIPVVLLFLPSPSRKVPQNGAMPLREHRFTADVAHFRQHSCVPDRDDIERRNYSLLLCKIIVFIFR